MIAEAKDHVPAAKPAERSPLYTFVTSNRRALSALAVLVVMLVIFYLANPRVFGNFATYRAVFISLPIAMFVAVPAVFIITSGEIDLSFPSTIGMSSWAFALALQAGWQPFLALIVAVIAGVATGFVVAILVTHLKLSSLVATLGMNFLLRGLITIGSEGNGIQFPQIRETLLWQIFAGRIGTFPIQLLWGIAFVALGWVLFNRHKFGVHVHCVGDNPDSAEEMGISVDRVKIQAFVFMGLGAALAGVLSVLVNQNWWPSTGDGYLLTTLAAVFVGGTPTWGGVGTVVGSAIGTATISFIETGIIAAGLTGYYTQFFNGLVIILSLIGHRFNGPRYR
jgi:ribose/xylose/arabinose/galactoside ABC-type transport system permease subunit